MKNSSCKFYPGCPPCFGHCGTHLAASDPSGDIPCKGCEKCKAEKAKSEPLPEYECKYTGPPQSTQKGKTQNGRIFRISPDRRMVT